MPDSAVPGARWARPALVGLLCAVAGACGASPLPARSSVAPAPSASERSAPIVAVAPEAPPVPDRYAVVSENATAVRAARAVLEAGGSAADAIVTGALVGCAAHPASCGLGGGGMALVWEGAQSRAEVLDFREAAPLGIKPLEHLGRLVPDAKRGVMIGVPGFVDGLATLHTRHGKLGWSELVSRAADVVEAGIPVSPYLEQVIALEREARHKVPLLGSRERSDDAAKELRNPALVATMRSLAKDGRDGFYRGPIATDLASSARSAGSRMVVADLARYRTEIREPLRMRVGERELLAVPSPSGGGLTVLATLGTVAPSEVPQLGWGSGLFVHVVAEAFRLAHSDRGLYIGDPAFTRADLDALLAPERLRARRERIRPDATTMPKLRSIADTGTQHWVVVDERGSMVSASFGLGSAFGARVSTPRGFVLNDALNDFTMDEYGARPLDRGANFPRGGARPATTAAPTIVLERGQPVLALGGSGGLRGPTGVALVLLGVFGAGLSLPESVGAPRFHVTPSGALKLEPSLAALADDLLARGEPVDAPSSSLAGVVAIALGERRGVRSLEPAFDPRRGGALTIGRDLPKLPATSDSLQGTRTSPKANASLPDGPVGTAR
jgi:gamma-glutamyltranspeptidase/glutathione hydrolase